MLSFAKKAARKARDIIGGKPSHLQLWQSVTELQHAAAVVDLTRRRASFAPRKTEVPAKQRIVVVAPHPDDEVIGCGGTLVMAKQNECEVKVIYITSQGFSGAAERVAEAREVSEKLGFEAVFLPFIPGQIPCSAEAAALLRDGIVSFAPTLLFLPFHLDDHDDHRRTVELFQTAFKGNPSQQGTTVWAYQVYSGAALPSVVDITGAAAEKRRLIALYRSEMTKRHWAHYALGQNAAASRFLPSRPEESYAELFLSCDVAAYLELAETYFSKGGTYLKNYVDS